MRLTLASSVKTQWPNLCCMAASMAVQLFHCLCWRSLSICSAVTSRESVPCVVVSSADQELVRHGWRSGLVLLSFIHLPAGAPVVRHHHPAEMPAGEGWGQLLRRTGWWCWSRDACYIRFETNNDEWTLNYVQNNINAWKLLGGNLAAGNHAPSEAKVS